MSMAFVSFDRLRGQIQAALETIQLPGSAPPIYLIRSLHGKVSISVSHEFEDDEDLRGALERLTLALYPRLGAHGYSSGRKPLWVWPELLAMVDGAAEEIAPGVFLEDRRTSSSDWWTVDGPDPGGRAIRYTLYSVRGGVGRSTTAAVLAWRLAHRGEDVLVVDLDLDSPGLGAALFGEPVRPDFGVTDWFVEELVGQGDRVLPEMVGSPAWAGELPGNVWIAPAHGRAPGEFLAKLGRVYMDTEEDPWIARLRRLLDGLEARLKPTVVLLDSRSGFHDSAAAVTNLGVEILLFGLDSPATWAGYRALFEHWRALGLSGRIRERLSFVSGLTPRTDADHYLARFLENLGDLFRPRLDDTLAGGADTGAHAIGNGVPARAAPPDPMVIYRDRGLATGSPLRRISESVVMPAYASFLPRFEQRHRARFPGPTPGAPSSSTGLGTRETGTG